MTAAARETGLTKITVNERPVDVGVTEPTQLVAYRFGQAPFTAWLESIGPAESRAVQHAAVQAIGPVMEPYRPIVVFLTAIRPNPHREGPER